jgi:hypothetical protein
MLDLNCALFVGFEVITTVIMKSSVLWCRMCYSLICSTQISHTKALGSIVYVENKDKLHEKIVESRCCIRLDQIKNENIRKICLTLTSWS